MGQPSVRAQAQASMAKYAAANPNAAATKAWAQAGLITPALNTPLPQAPSAADQAALANAGAQAAARRRRRVAAGTQGLASTISSGPSGVTTPPPLILNRLLGI